MGLEPIHVHVATCVNTKYKNGHGCVEVHVHKYMFLMRDEKEERKKQARSNKQGKATQHTQGSHFS